MADIAIAVALGLLTLLTAYLGVHVTLHPAESNKSKWAYKIAFTLCGLAICALIAVQTKRNSDTQDALRQEILQIEKNTKEPPKV
jgi:hypothetical protein